MKKSGMAAMLLAAGLATQGAQAALVVGTFDLTSLSVVNNGSP